VTKRRKTNESVHEKIKVYERNIYHTNPKIRNSLYLRKYGITLEMYNTMLNAQSGVCKVCSARPKRKRLSVDHNHQTGKVRGLLCDRCNQAIAVLENVILMRQLNKFLLQGSEDDTH